jgi:hypothetical protein
VTKADAWLAKILGAQEKDAEGLGKELVAPSHKDILRSQWMQYYLDEMAAPSLAALREEERELLLLKVAAKVSHNLCPARKIEIWKDDKTVADPTPSVARIQAAILVREAAVAVAKARVNDLQGQMDQWTAAEARAAKAIEISKAMREASARETNRCGKELSAARRTLEIEQAALQSERTPMPETSGDSNG